jgi:hypothetical protein
MYCILKKQNETLNILSLNFKNNNNERDRAFAKENF